MGATRRRRCRPRPDPRDGPGHLTGEQREFGAAFLGGRGWGLGTSVVLRGPCAGATGWDGGLGTSFLVHPARDLAVPAAVRDPQPPAVHTDLQAAALTAAE